jgi:hypothetical protein
MYFQFHQILFIRVLLTVYDKDLATKSFSQFVMLRLPTMSKLKGSGMIVFVPLSTDHNLEIDYAITIC